MDDYPEYRFALLAGAAVRVDRGARIPSCSSGSRVKVAGGQWIPVGGMWVEADMNLPSGESLVRQIVHGQRYFESRFGRRCTEVWIPDVFGYPASMPQLYAPAGCDRFVTQKLSWNTHQPLPAPHVLVGGARRHAGAHPLPAGRHLQRRDHPGRVRRVGRPLPRRGLVGLVADAVRLRRRRRRADARDARAGAPAGRPRRRRRGSRSVRRPSSSSTSSARHCRAARRCRCGAASSTSRPTAAR